MTSRTRSSEHGASPPNRRRFGLAVLVGLVAVLALAYALALPLQEKAPGGARVEQSSVRPEVVVYVEPNANKQDRTDGGETVTVECFDRRGRVLASQTELWPFGDTDQNTLDPHVHVAIARQELAKLDECRLTGTEPLLQDRLK